MSVIQDKSPEAQSPASCPFFDSVITTFTLSNCGKTHIPQNVPCSLSVRVQFRGTEPIPLVRPAPWLISRTSHLPRRMRCPCSTLNPGPLAPRPRHARPVCLHVRLHETTQHLHSGTGVCHWAHPVSVLRRVSEGPSFLGLSPVPLYRQAASCRPFRSLMDIWAVSGLRLL